MPDYTPGLTLITPSGGRPETFALCQKYVARQTYSGPMQWVVVDDVGDTPAPEMDARFEVVRVSPKSPWSGQNTLARNIAAALPHVKYDKILAWEDDDFYPPEYCAQMAKRLESASIVGSPISRYYHIPSRRYRIMQNSDMASLCQTGIRSELIPVLKNVCQYPDYVDAHLWQMANRYKRDLRYVPGDCVGMKGLPGRKGIGIGHRPDEQAGQWTEDTVLGVLKSWIGADVELYRKWL